MKRISYKKKIKNLLRVDPIRGMKLLEFAQYAALATAFALLTGPFINIALFSKSNDEKTTTTLLIEIFIEMGIIGALIYYIKKIMRIIPFFFKNIYSKYIPSYHNEAMVGTAIGLGIVFNQTQTNLLGKINIISNRYSHYLEKI